MSAMRIFVSHSHTNNAFCAELVRALRRAGADVWYDDESLHTGQLGPIIERELRERPVFVIVLSPAALASRWVEDETRWAYNRLRRDPSRIMLPVLAEALPDADDIWLFLQDFKRIEAPGPGCRPHPEAVTYTLHALQLTLPGEAPLPTAPQPAESADDLLTRGKALSAQGKHAEALPLFHRATQLDPLSFDAWANLGYTLNELKRYEESLPACDRALALDEKQTWVWGNKGVALRNLGRAEEALVAYDRALTLDPNYALAWNNKGNALNNLKRYEEALVALDRALTLDPNYALAWNNKGAALDVLNRHEEALVALDRALALDPNNASVWNNKAMSLLGQWRLSEAIQPVDRSLALNPNLGQAWDTKGQILNAQRRFEDALLCLNRALALGENAIRWHNKSIALQGLGRAREAEEADQRAKELGG